jgi:ABC-type amino acid transport substrate-binding protein
VGSSAVCPTDMALRRRYLVTGMAAGLGALLVRTPLARAAGLPPVKTVTDGALTVALTGDLPMSAVKDGEIIGTDGVMISLVAKRLGLKAVPALMDWSSCIEAVRGGRADLTLGNMGWTIPRAEVMQLTDAVYYTGKYTLMRKDMAVGDHLTLDDLKGHSVGTVTAFTIVPELKKVPGTTDVKLYDNTDSCVRDIRAGRLDFAFLDTPTVGYMIAQNPDWDLKLLPTAPFPGFKLLGQKQISVFGMNPENFDLFDAVNAGVGWLWQSGNTARILAQYGMGNPDYLVKLTTDIRLGVDRDDKGAVLGKFAHTPRDFSAAFVG